MLKEVLIAGCLCSAFLLALPWLPRLQASERGGLPYWISAEQAEALENENFTLSPGFFDPVTPMFEREIIFIEPAHETEYSKSLKEGEINGS